MRIPQPPAGRSWNNATVTAEGSNLSVLFNSGHTDTGVLSADCKTIHWADESIWYHNRSGAGPAPPPSPPNPLCTSVPGRPTFHMAGELKPRTQHTTHMNDINSIFFFKGLYHAMFQERKPYPCADWAHLVSKDMAVWRRLPDALSPTKHSFDGGGVLDGQVSLLPGLPPVILYDAHNPERGRDCPVSRSARRLDVGSRLGDPPTIGMAHPADASDPELREWKKSKVLVKFPRGQYSGPTRIWRNDKLKNYNLLMYNGPTQPNSIYSTNDSSFRTWTGGGPFTPPSIQGGCGRNFARLPGTNPPLYLVQSNSTNNSNDAINAMAYYAVGAYDEASNTFSPTVSGAKPMTVDFGGCSCNELGVSRRDTVGIWVAFFSR